MIKNKPKKCKGSGKAKGSGCGEVLYMHRYGLCRSCFKDWCLNTEEGKKYLKSVSLKVTAPRIKMEKQLKSAMAEKKNRKNLQWYLNDVRSVVHKYVKERDKGRSCISCGTAWHSDFQAGHFYKAELYSHLRFNLDNIHAQCVRCNIHLEGNLNPYADNLVKKIGEKRFEALKKTANDTFQKSKKWDKEWLKSYRANVQAMYKKLVQKSTK